MDFHDVEIFKNFVKRDLNMDFVYQKKFCISKSDGNAIFYNEEKFELVKKFFINFNFKNASNYDQNDLLKKNLSFPSNALFAILQTKNIDKKKILVVNTHLLFDPNRGDIKLSMIIMIKKSINLIKKIYKIEDVFFAGDFNLVPNSMLYDFITKQKIDLDINLKEYSNQEMMMENSNKNLEELILLGDRKFSNSNNKQKNSKVIEKDLLERLINVSPVICNDNEEINFSLNNNFLKSEESINFLENLSMDNSFISLYSKFNHKYLVEKQKYLNNKFNYENSFTHFAHDLKSTVDYIFMSSQNYYVKSVLNNPCVTYLTDLKKTAPNNFFGSDHFSLVADLVLKK